MKRLILLIILLLPLSGMHAQEAALNEKLGKFVPQDAQFTDSTGKLVKLADVLESPTILQLVFFHCPRACGLQTAYLAEALTKIDDQPISDYRVLTISFDEMDKFELARQMKMNYMNLLDSNFPQAAWRFMVGDVANIKKLTQSLGFSFKRTGHHTFAHPTVLIILAENGQIVRYLHGEKAFPFDLSMALAEAKQGIIGVSVKKALSYCFDYDPIKKRYVFRMFRVIGTVIVLFLAGFYFFFLRKKRN